jgi:predicted RNA-binding protein
MVNPINNRLQNIEKRLEEITKIAIQRQNQNTKDLFIDENEFQYIMAFCPNTAKDWRREGLVAYTQKDGKFFYTIKAVNKMLVEQFSGSKKK